MVISTSRTHGGLAWLQMYAFQQPQQKGCSEDHLIRASKPFEMT